MASVALRATAALAVALVSLRLVQWLIKARKRKLKLAKTLANTGGPREGDAGHSGWEGSVPDLIKNMHRFHDWRVDLFKRFSCSTMMIQPPTIAGYLWGARVIPIFTSDPKNVEYILKTNFSNYIKGERVWLSLNELLGNGIFIANHAHTKDSGASWTLQRKIASKIFTGNRFRKHMQGVFLRHGHSVLDILGSHADTGKPVDLVTLFFKYTMDSIGEIGFGVDLDTLHKDTVPFVHAFDEAQQMGFERQFSPVVGMWSAVFGESWTSFAKHVVPSERKLHGHLAVLDKFALDVISERRLGGGPTQSNQDLLSLFMLAGADTEKGSKGFSDIFLRDIIMSFIIAGRDTTAVTLSWAVFMLLQEPDVLEKLLAEIDITLNGDEPTYDNLKSMAYLDGVVNEALRLHPPVPIDPKEAFEDDVLPDGSFVPSGCTVAYDPYAMGRDASIWPEPLKVDPTRWVGHRKPSPYEFPVFQAGPRICLGMNMAYFEVKVLLVMLLQKFTFALHDDPTDISYVLTVTLNMTHMNVKVLPR
jgi:fatty acid omega-hydroxylase